MVICTIRLLEVKAITLHGPYDSGHICAWVGIDNIEFRDGIVVALVDKPIVITVSISSIHRVGNRVIIDHKDAGSHCHRLMIVSITLFGQNIDCPVCDTRILDNKEVE